MGIRVNMLQDEQRYYIDKEMHAVGLQNARTDQARMFTAMTSII